MNQIRGITFDVGGTLIEPWPSVGHVYAEVAGRHGMTGIQPELLTNRFKAAWHSCHNFDYTRAGWENLVNQTFDGLFAATIPANFFPDLYERFAQPDTWRIFDDVCPTLESLRSRNFRMAIISNWDERLRVLLERLGLARYFETLVISCEAGPPKPSPVIFEQAATHLGLAPDSLLHVGDDREMDVQGAVNAGFRALLLRRSGQRQSMTEITSLAELPRLPWLNKAG